MEDKMQITDIDKAFDYVTETLNDSIDFPHIETGNDGIGQYEFWGQKCNDSGNDYYYVDEFDRDITIEFNMISVDLLKMIVDYYTLEECYKSSISDTVGNSDIDLIKYIVTFTVQNIKLNDNFVTFTIHWEEVQKFDL